MDIIAPIHPDGAKRLFDYVIYLHGSTCVDRVGLTMTFAHELQHFVQQHGSAQRLWAENQLIKTLITTLPEGERTALGLMWSDIPIEREARIVSKRTAETLFGAEPVRQFIEQRIIEAVDKCDAANWRFIQGIVFPIQIDLAGDTQRLYHQLKGYRLRLEELLQEMKKQPEFKDVELTS